MTKNKTKTYLIECKDKKSQRITIPEDWKVTFGPLNPGTRGEHKLALRIYENKEKQRACFVNVLSFRDLEIPVEEKTVSAQRKTATMNDNGTLKDFIVEQVVEEWVNPDAPGQQRKDLSLPSLGFVKEAEEDETEDL